MYLAPALAIVALLFAIYKISFVSKQAAGTDRMKEIAASINEGAKAFLLPSTRSLRSSSLSSSSLSACSSVRIAGSPQCASSAALCSPFSPAMSE